MKMTMLPALVLAICCFTLNAQDWWKPYTAPQTERANHFEFTKKPTCRYLGDDKFEITFAVKDFCDATVSILDAKGKVIRHVGSGVLGRNAPPPFQKNKLTQTVIWNGKNDLKIYIKNPTKLRVRVSLGLKPTFDKLLAWNPKDLIGHVHGLGIDDSGIYVISGSNPQLRRYDRDGNYVKTIFPPAANIPYEKLKGMETLAIGPKERALHSQTGHGDVSSVSGFGTYLSGIIAGSRKSNQQQIVLFNGWICFANGGRVKEVWLTRMKTADGTSDEKSFRWRALSRRKGGGKTKRIGYYKSGEFAGTPPKMAASPDGHWLYLSAMSSDRTRTAVYRLDTRNRDGLADKPFIGTENKPGSDNKHFADAQGIACDAKGRIYVCDPRNNRIQVFGQDGGYLKSIKMSGPLLIQIHSKTGALYVMHSERVNRKTIMRLSKLKSFENPTMVAHYDFSGPKGREPKQPMFIVDSRKSPERVWVANGNLNIQIYEEKGSGFKLIRDFMKDAKATDGIHETVSTPSGQDFKKISADPMREQVYFKNQDVYDIKTGRFLHQYKISPPDDLAFDRRGYMHVHFWKYVVGVGRVDPGSVTKKDGRSVSFLEVPYDYGVATKGYVAWKGVLDMSRINPGNGKYQEGIAANMQGDINVECNIRYVPKMEDSVKAQYPSRRHGTGTDYSYEGFMRRTKDAMKRGSQIYSVKRTPGRVLSGGTYWIFDSTGELRSENIVTGLGHVNGAGMDEDGAVYVGFNSTKMIGGQAFLSNRSKQLGTNKKAQHAFTGTILKAPSSGAQVLRASAPIVMDPMPTRPTDLASAGWGSVSTKATGWANGTSDRSWMKDAEWLFAGYGPIVPVGCICMNARFYTDWYKRTFLPETYRHSIGVIDTAGNLVVHVGRYGNADSGRGPKSPVKVGGDEVALAHTPYVTATDNYLCISDLGNERIVVVKLGYHVEETVSIKVK